MKPDWENMQEKYLKIAMNLIGERKEGRQLSKFHLNRGKNGSF